jgi:hypothetical protein
MTAEDIKGGGESLVAKLEETVRRNPIGVGAVALGVGALVGLAIPLTESENDLMGATRDDLLGAAHDLASDAIDRASRVVEEAKEAVVEKATHEGLLR